VPQGYPWGAAAAPGIDEKTALAQQTEALKAQLASISERLQALEDAQ